ncbi:MAG: hypothetical protein ACI8Z5_001336 [Lentimonas sp.]|jgi:hypothetical protein
MLKELESEVQALTQQAEQCDRSQHQDCAFNLPEEIARRKQRKVRIQEAIDVIELFMPKSLKSRSNSMNANSLGVKRNEQLGKRYGGVSRRSPPRKCRSSVRSIPLH